MKSHGSPLWRRIHRERLVTVHKRGVTCCHVVLSPTSSLHPSPNTITQTKTEPLPWQLNLHDDQLYLTCQVQLVIIVPQWYLTGRYSWSLLSLNDATTGAETAPYVYRFRAAKMSHCDVDPADVPSRESFVDIVNHVALC